LKIRLWSPELRTTTKMFQKFCPFSKNLTSSKTRSPLQVRTTSTRPLPLPRPTSPPSARSWRRFKQYLSTKYPEHRSTKPPMVNILEEMVCLGDIWLSGTSLIMFYRSKITLYICLFVFYCNIFLSHYYCVQKYCVWLRP